MSDRILVEIVLVPEKDPVEPAQGFGGGLRFDLPEDCRDKALVAGYGVFDLCRHSGVGHGVRTEDEDKGSGPLDADRDLLAPCRGGRNILQVHPGLPLAGFQGLMQPAGKGPVFPGIRDENVKHGSHLITTVIH